MLKEILRTQDVVIFKLKLQTKVWVFQLKTERNYSSHILNLKMIKVARLMLKVMDLG